MGHSATDNSTAPRARGSLLIFACFCACALVLHVRAGMPARHTLDRRRDRAAAIRERIDAEILRGQHLRQLGRALEDDPQTIERELRRRGFGREREMRLVPAEAR